MSDETQPETLDLDIEAGGLKQAPVWEAHKRGKNWMAKIAIDPTAPGGLKREWARKAFGDFTYLVERWMEPSTPVEFGADYYTGSGKKKADRWYGVIESIDATRLRLTRYATARDAIAASQKPPEPKE